MTVLRDLHWPLFQITHFVKILLTSPLAKLKTCGDRAFRIAAPSQWNNLPLSIRKSLSIAIYKRHLKTYLFNEAYGF